MKKNLGLLITMILGFISFVFVILDYLALTDIWHNNEFDFRFEWGIVTVSVFPIVAFHILFAIFVIIPSIKKVK